MGQETVEVVFRCECADSINVSQALKKLGKHLIVE